MRASNVLRLTTTDPDTGQERTVALPYTAESGRHVVDAASEPDWYHDILVHPMVNVAIGEDDFWAVAVPAVDGSTVALERSEAAAEEEPAAVKTLADTLLVVHAWLRSQLRHVRSESEAHFAASSEESKPALGLQLRQHCLAFCQSLEFHHSREDQMFPGLATYHPELVETVERLASEHRVIARLQSELAALLADIGRTDRETFTAELDRLSEELISHLDYEESQLLPVLAAVPFPPAGPPET